LHHTEGKAVGDEDAWAPAGERYRVTHGYQSRVLNVHKSFAVAVGAVRGLLSEFLGDLFEPVPKTFVAIMDRGSGATLKRWDLDAEGIAPVPTTEYLVKEVTADLMLLDVAAFVDKYKPTDPPRQ
jgi:hypothetical protein